VKLLLTSQANFNVADNNGASPLHFAVLNGHKECASVLLDKGADIAIEDEQGNN